jgi:sugar phosphate isomerase/epimerase
MSVSESAVSAEIYTVQEFIRTPSDFARSLRKIRSIGYRAIEISDLGHIPTDTVKTILDDMDLVVSGCHYDLDQYLTRLDSIIDECRAWNCGHLLLTMIPESYALLGAGGYSRFIEEICPIGEKIHEAGLTLSYHNHNYEFARFDGRTGLDWILEETQTHHIGMQIDTYWVQMGGGDPIQWIRKSAGRMPAVHLKDFAVDMWTPIFAELGQGNLDWPGIIQACREADVAWYVVEQDSCRRDPFESLKISYEFLNTFGLS